ncbi:hypothetical protein Tco_0999292 [Tanacetum coccineum]
MNNLETQLNEETLQEMDSKSALSVTKEQFERFINSDLLKPLDIYSRSFSSDREIQQCKVQKVQSLVTSSGDESSSGIVSEEEIDKKELEAHHGFMAKIQEVLPAESSSTDTPLEQVQNNDENNVFANERQHSAECTDDRDALANLIANLTLDTE